MALAASGSDGVRLGVFCASVSSQARVWMSSCGHGGGHQIVFQRVVVAPVRLSSRQQAIVQSLFAICPWVGIPPSGAVSGIKSPVRFLLFLRLLL